MCEELRKKYGVADEWVKDTHLTNWFKKNFGECVVAVFSLDKEARGTLTKRGFRLGMGAVLVCFKAGHSVLISSSEFTTFEKY